MRNLSQKLSFVLFAVFSCLAAAQLKAAAPIFRESYSFTNNNASLRSFNNAGDLTVTYYDTQEQRYVEGLIRNGNFVNLSSVADARVQSLTSAGISQRRPDGGVYVTGWASMTDGYFRATLWNVAADGTYSFTIATNIVLPEDSYAPGEQGRGYGVGVNTSGTMVGNGSSYLAGVAIRWTPPYNAAQRFLLSTGSSFVDINEDGTMLANGIEFDHGGEYNRLSAGIVAPGGGVTEIPLLEKVPNRFYPDSAKMMRGDWVTGNCMLGDVYRAFVWKNGWAGSLDLPNPSFAPNAKNMDAMAVNSSGNVLGRVNGGTGSGMLIYWANENGNFKPYAFWELLPTEYYFASYETQNALINDAGQVAVGMYTGNNYIVRVYDPVHDGIVQFSEAYGTGSEETGKMTFKVKLLRATENTLPVTVNFQTADDTATAPKDYIATTGSVTWNPGESGDKLITIPIVDNLTFDADRSFKIRLTGVTGAQLAGVTEGAGYLSDGFQQVNPRNQIVNDGGYGVTVLAGSSEVILEFERTGGTDGKLTVTNLHTFDSTAAAGVDYDMPQNVSLTWAAGEGGVKTLHVPLKTAATITSAKTFTVTGDVFLEGAQFNLSTYAAVSILPKQNQTRPVVNTADTGLVSNKLKFTVTAPQGSIVQLQSLADLAAQWGIETESTVSNGEVTFEISVDPAVAAKFFQVRSKP